jgi:predicted Rossmann-fold nucleotide-binding protein
VFCGSSAGTDGVYRTATIALSRELASRGIGVVYGGASVGLMGVIVAICARDLKSD